MQVDQYFVAFIDILGFAEKVQRDFSNAELMADSNLDSIRQAVLAARALGDVDAKISVDLFSDSIVVWTLFSREAFTPFLDACTRLQADLIKMGVLVRGGVAYGKHYSEDGIVYSAAIIDAYRLELKEAEVPRILISPDLADIMELSGGDSQSALRVDEDRYLFLNFSRFFSQDECQMVSAALDRQLENCRGRVARKLSWLKRALHEGQGLPA
jgi:hypothetical protein